MLKIIKKYSPKEVYILAGALFFLLFLNSTEIFYYLRFKDIFDIKDSIIYGLIRGVGDDQISRREAVILYWTIASLYTGIITIKARKISLWLWSN